MNATRSRLLPRVDARSARGLIAALVLFQVFALFLRAWLQQTLERGGLDARTAADASYLVVPVILVLCGWPLATAQTGFPGRLLAAVPRWSHIAVALAIGALLRVAWWAQVFAGVYVGGDQGEWQAAAIPLFDLACPPAGTLLLYLAVMAVLVPLVEEIINRGYILHALLRPEPRRHTYRAVLVSSLLFGVFHPPGSMLAAAIAGIPLSLLVLSSGSLWPPIVAHATYNALIAVDWLCLKVTWMAPTGGDRRLALMSAALCVGCFVAAVLLALRPGAPSGRRPRSGG